MKGNGRWQTFWKRSLSWKEAVSAILALAGAACAIYFLFSGAAWIVLRVKVRHATPQVLSEVSKQRDVLVAAIEAFKRKYGVYPPDHLIDRESKIVDSVTNQLLYELTGTIFDPGKTNYSCQGFEPLSETTLRQFFNRSNFINSGLAETNIYHFLARENLVTKEINDGPDVNVIVPNALPEGMDQDLLWEFEISSWRYVSSFPTNNHGRFDLWTDVIAGNKQFKISNW